MMPHKARRKAPGPHAKPGAPNTATAQLNAASTSMCSLVRTHVKKIMNTDAKINHRPQAGAPTR